MIHQQINNIIVILLLGSLVILSFVHFANPLKVNKRGNNWFAIFLLFYASFWLEELSVLSGFGDVNIHVISVVRMLQIFTAPTLYLSIIYYAQPDFKIQVKYWYHSIIPFIHFIIYLLPYFSGNNIISHQVFGVITMLIQATIYAALSYIKIKEHQRHILNYSSNTQGIELKWLEYIILQIIFLLAVMIFHSIFIRAAGLNAFMNGVQLLTAFVIAFFSWRQKEIYPVKEEQKKELHFVDDEKEPAQKKKKLMEDAELLSFQKKLNDLMNKQKPYLDSELNLVKLAEIMALTSHQLSFLINAGFNENFYQFINKFRVERAKELLKSNDDNLTMLAIAFDSGFNSKTSFNTTFKKITQQTPSEFKNQSSNL